MKCFIIGQNKLAYHLYHELRRLNHEVVIYSLDTLNYTALASEFEHLRPNVVFKCDEFDDVDYIELNQELAYNLNYLTTKTIVDLCEKYKSDLLYVSNTYIFDGSKKEPYSICDKRDPINYYGILKSMCEDEVNRIQNKYIVRTSWLFDVDNADFINKIMECARAKRELKVVTDQIGSPTYAVDLASTIAELGTSGVYGIYNVSSEGNTSRYELAKYICKINDLPDIIIPTLSNSVHDIATRPLNQTLDNSLIYEMGYDVPNWRESIEHFNQDIKKLVRK